MLSDGRANVSLPGSTGDVAWEQTRSAAEALAGALVPTLLLDTETGFIRMGRGQELAQALNAEYLTLDDLSIDS